MCHLGLPLILSLSCRLVRSICICQVVVLASMTNYAAVLFTIFLSGGQGQQARDGAFSAAGTGGRLGAPVRSSGHRPVGSDDIFRSIGALPSAAAASGLPGANSARINPKSLPLSSQHHCSPSLSGCRAFPDAVPLHIPKMRCPKLWGCGRLAGRDGAAAGRAALHRRADTERGQRSSPDSSCAALADGRPVLQPGQSRASDASKCAINELPCAQWAVQAAAQVPPQASTLAAVPLMLAKFVLPKAWLTLLPADWVALLMFLCAHMQAGLGHQRWAQGAPRTAVAGLCQAQRRRRVSGQRCVRAGPPRGAAQPALARRKRRPAPGPGWHL